MPVDEGAKPTQLNLNASSPAIPSGKPGVQFQVGSAYPDPNVPGAMVRDVSAYGEARNYVALSDGDSPPGFVSVDAGEFIYVDIAI